MFLDAMEFWNDHSGIVMGDPIDGKFFIARSFDGGSTGRKFLLQISPSQIVVKHVLQAAVQISGS